MNLNWSGIGKELAIAALVLLLFGVVYNLVVEHFQKRTQRYTAELVAIGIVITLAASGFIIGWENVLIVLILFVFSGGPMMIGSWVRTARDEEAAKKIAQQSAQELTR